MGLGNCQVGVSENEGKEKISSTRFQKRGVFV